MNQDRIKVELGAADLEAWVTVLPADEAVTKDQILGELNRQGVVQGIDLNAIQTLVQNQLWGVRTLVARGTPPCHGEDGWIEYFFDTSSKPQPKQLENGRVDYKQIGLIQSVEKDALLARIVPPQRGVPGITVRGKDIPARSGTAATVAAGPNTHFTGPDNTELRAAVSGAVSMTRGIISVDQTYTLKGSVDFSSGNIDFPGDVIINGNVTAGFSVRAAGRVEIRGIVEDATVEAKGDVLVKGGFEGYGRGVIRSGGMVHIKFVENQTVIACGSIYVGEDVLNANLQSDDGIFLTTGIGTVIGGRLRARSGITAKVLGNPQCTPTAVEIYQLQPDEVLLAEKETVAGEKTRELNDIAALLPMLQQRKMSDPQHSQEIDAEIGKLQQRLLLLKEELTSLTQAIKTLKAEVEKSKRIGRIHVLSKVYPGVEITIAGMKYSVTEALGKTIFKKKEAEIAVLPVQAAEAADPPSLESAAPLSAPEEVA
jgi:uncharacterized protein (DUF342 family)